MFQSLFVMLNILVINLRFEVLKFPKLGEKYVPLKVKKRVGGWELVKLEVERDWVSKTTGRTSMKDWEKYNNDDKKFIKRNLMAKMRKQPYRQIASLKTKIKHSLA